MEATKSKPASCLARFDQCERRACATGSAWGKIKSPGGMMLFWLVRHAFYIGAASILIFVEPMASSTATLVIVGGVFSIAHIWKILSIIIRNSQDENAQRAIAPAAAPKAIDVERIELQVILPLVAHGSSGLGLATMGGKVEVISMSNDGAGAAAKVKIGDAITAVDGLACGSDMGKVLKAFRVARSDLSITISRAKLPGFGPETAAAVPTTPAQRDLDVEAGVVSPVVS